MLDRLGRWTAKEVHRTDAMLVAGDRGRQARVMLFDLTMLVLAVIAWTFWSGQPTVLGGIASVFVALQLGRMVIQGQRRAMAYRDGWLKGRTEFVYSMIEAERRGMEPGEWLVAQAERDWKVLGFEHDEIAAVMESIRRQAEDE